MANVTAPTGFVTDGATIPRWITAVGIIIVLVGYFLGYFGIILAGCSVAIVPVVFTRTNKYFAAAIIHDYYLHINPDDMLEADKIFKICLKELGISPLRYVPMYVVVRLYSLFKGGCVARKNK